MPLTDGARNAAIDAIAAVYDFASLHSSNPGTTGANELTGGSYARQAITWGAAASGQADQTGDLVVDVPGGSDVAFIGIWDALTVGNFGGYFPNGGVAPMAATLAEATDTFTSFAHGLSDGNRVVLFDIQAAGLPTGFTEGVIYFVRDATTDTFALAATAGGAAITVTTSAEVAVQKLVLESFGADGTFTIADGSLVLDARFI